MTFCMSSDYVAPDSALLHRDDASLTPFGRKCCSQLHRNGDALASRCRALQEHQPDANFKVKKPCSNARLFAFIDFGTPAERSQSMSSDALASRCDHDYVTHHLDNTSLSLFGCKNRCKCKVLPC